LVIKLKESTQFLESVVITPVDEARLLVEQAIQNISTNYPPQSTQLEGFLRGVMKKGDSIAYVTEGLYLVEKERYTKATKKGKVKLLKGRAVEAKEIAYSFYGAHHVAHYSDFVHYRPSFINTSKTKHYNYNILDTLNYDDRNVVRVGFQLKKKKQKAEGELFINLEDYAFVKIKYQYYGDEDEDDLLEKVRGTKRLFRKYKIEYKPVDSLWHLSFIEYKSAMSIENGKDTLRWTDVFSTTKIKKTNESISYEDQLQYMDITLRTMGEYDSTFWRNYNIVLPSRETESLFKKYDPSKTEQQLTGKEEALSKRKKMLNQMSKFKFTIGVFAQPATIDNVLINYINGSSIITETVPNTNFYYTGLSSATEYFFSPSFFIGLDTKASFAGNKYSSISFKTGYNKDFTAFGRPATANFSVNMGHYRFGYVVGKYNVANNLEINGKPFDSGEVRVSLESRRWAVEPTIRLSLEMSRILSLFAEGGWNMPFSSTDGLYFKEKGQPFWKTKQAFVGLPHPDINISDGANELTEVPLNTNLMLNVGVLIHFNY